MHIVAIIQTTTGTTLTRPAIVSHSYVASRAGRHVTFDADTERAAMKRAHRLDPSAELFRETPIGFVRVWP